MNNWFQYARLRARAASCATGTSTSTSGRAGTSAAIGSIRGGNINTHWTWTNNYSFGVGLNFNAAPFRDRVTRGGPGVLGNPNRSLWFYGNTDNRRSLSFSYNGYHEADGLGTIRRNINPWLNLPALVGNVALGRNPLRHQPATTPSG